jgi:hypothetical protein
MHILKLTRWSTVVGFVGWALSAALFALKVLVNVPQLTAILVLIGAIVGVIWLKLLINWVRGCRALVQHYLLGDILVLIGLAQILVATHFVDYGRADSFFIRDQAVILANQGTTWSHYFYVYSNNVNLAKS